MRGKRNTCQENSPLSTSISKRPRLEPEPSSNSERKINSNNPFAYVAETPVDALFKIIYLYISQNYLFIFTTQWLTTIPNSQALQLSISSETPNSVNSSTAASSLHPNIPTAVQPASVKRYSALASSLQPFTVTASVPKAGNTVTKRQQTSSSVQSSGTGTGNGEWVVWENKRVRNFKPFRKVWGGVGAASQPASSSADEQSSASIGRDATSSSMSSSFGPVSWRAVKPFAQRESDLPDDNFSGEFAQPFSAAPHASQSASSRYPCLQLTHFVVFFFAKSSIYTYYVLAFIIHSWFILYKYSQDGSRDSSPFSITANSNISCITTLVTLYLRFSLCINHRSIALQIDLFNYTSQLSS